MPPLTPSSARTRYQARYLHRLPLLGLYRSPLRRLHASRRLRLATILLRRSRLCRSPPHPSFLLRRGNRLQTPNCSLTIIDQLTKSLERLHRERAHRLRTHRSANPRASTPHIRPNPQTMERSRPRSPSLHDRRPFFHIPTRPFSSLGSSQLWHLHRPRRPSLQLHLPHPHHPTTLQLGSCKSVL